MMSSSSINTEPVFPEPVEPMAERDEGKDSKEYEVVRENSISNKFQSMDIEVKKKPSNKIGHVLHNHKLLLILLVAVVLLCLLIGISCYYGGKASRKSQQSQPPATPSGSTTKPPPSPEELRLPKSLIPSMYHLKVKTYLPPSGNDTDDYNVTFHGELSIDVKCKEDVQVVTLNSVNLNITEMSVKVTGNRNHEIKVIRMEEKKELEMVLFHLGEKLLKGAEYTIFTKYRGDISENLDGFYWGHYLEDGLNKTKRYFGVTKFLPTHARKAFPGFDEPEFKAVFKITMEHPSEFTALSNGKLMSRNEIKPGWTETTFHESDTMSSYLVAWAITTFSNITIRIGESGTRFEFWSRPSVIGQLEYPKQFAPKALAHMEHFYKHPIKLEKQDIIALPDFGASITENWGLITVHENNLLYDNQSSYSLIDKQWVTLAITRELTQQWFGNLVTAAWWDELWLNEGLANLMQYIVAESVAEKKEMFYPFITADVQKAMRRDQLASSHPLLTYIGKAGDIYENFDAISSEKGAAVIRMVMAIMGEENFFQGIRIYLQTYDQKIVDHNNLWNSLSKAVKSTTTDWDGKKINITEFADPWTVQMGFPLINVTRDYNTFKVMVSQEQFKLNPNATEKEQYQNPRYKYQWYVPLWYQTKGVAKKEQPEWLTMHGQKTLSPRLASDHWILLNANGRGYHRTTYDTRTWNQLIHQLQTGHKEIPLASRCHLIDDAFTLAQAGLIEYEIPLNLINYLANEEEYLPWFTALTHFHQLRNYFLETSSYGYFKMYMLNVTQPIYSNYSWDYTVSDKDVLKERLQSAALDNACLFGNANCTGQAQATFSEMKDKNCSRSEDKLSSACNRTGPWSEWEYLWNKYLIEDNAVEKLSILTGLTCSKDSWTLTWLLNKALKGEKVHQQDVAYLFSNIAANSVGRLLLWVYVEKNWAEITKKFGNRYATMNSIIRSATLGMTNSYHLTQLEHFLQTHPTDAHKYGAFHEVLETTKINAAWMHKNFMPLTRWLKKSHNWNVKPTTTTYLDTSTSTPMEQMSSGKSTKSTTLTTSTKSTTTTTTSTKSTTTASSAKSTTVPSNSATESTESNLHAGKPTIAP